jgi:hypothetical protein
MRIEVSSWHVESRHVESRHVEKQCSKVVDLLKIRMGPVGPIQIVKPKKAFQPRKTRKNTKNQ